MPKSVSHEYKPSPQQVRDVIAASSAVSANSEKGPDAVYKAVESALIKQQKENEKRWEAEYKKREAEAEKRAKAEIVRVKKDIARMVVKPRGKPKNVVSPRSK